MTLNGDGMTIWLRPKRQPMRPRPPVMAADITGDMSPASAGGEALHITTEGGVHVNGAAVTAADIACTNGVIHVIDAVLLPAA